jgi:hypothetical protein
MRSAAPLTFDPPPDRAAAIERLAEAARGGSVEARNDLFAELADPIGRAVARRRYLCSGLERAEVTAETFIALADLLDGWVDGDFVADFGRRYGGCLTRRLARLRWPGWRRQPLPPWELPAPDGETALARAVAELTDLTATERWLVEQRIAGASTAQVARALGLTHRTMNRRWAALVVRLRQSM